MLHLPPHADQRFVAQTSQDGGKKGVNLHAVPASPVPDDLVEQVIEVQRERAVQAVVKRDALERDFGHLQDLDPREQVQGV